jgi:hypothetical protein
MNYYILNYGKQKENYNIYFYNEISKDEQSFLTDIQQVFRSNWHEYFIQNEQDNFVPWGWVDFSKKDFIKLGYKLVKPITIWVDTSNSLNEHYDFRSENTSIKLEESDVQSNFKVFDICFYHYGNGVTDDWSCLFINDKKTNEQFKADTTEFFKLKPIIYGSYIKDLELFMISKGYEAMNPNFYGIDCSSSGYGIPSRWEEILGQKLFYKINLLSEALGMSYSSICEKRRKANQEKTKTDDRLDGDDLPF